jgi:hypothetical protein
MSFSKLTNGSILRKLISADELQLRRLQPESMTRFCTLPRRLLTEFICDG